MVALGVMRYRVMVGQQLQIAAEPGQLIDGLRSLGTRRASVARCPSAIQFQLQFFFSCSPRDELFPDAAKPVNRDHRRAVISKLAPVRHSRSPEKKVCVQIEPRLPHRCRFARALQPNYLSIAAREWCCKRSSCRCVAKPSDRQSAANFDAPRKCAKACTPPRC